jgi:dTDP-4-dehydrorhamnose reductase
VDVAAPGDGGDAAADRERLLRRVVVVGATGALGHDLVDAFAADAVTALGHDRLEITDAAQVRDVLGALAPDVVVNTAAFHNVPRCETEEVAAFTVNAVGPRHLARACTELGARLVHVSTDYVFDGAKRAPYVEEDRPNPVNVYGISKLAGEYAVLSAGGNHQVVRSSGLYGLWPCRAKGGNFVDAMFRAASQQPVVRVVADEVLTPTSTADLAAQIRVLSEAGEAGLFHATAQEQCSWYDFARVVFEVAGLTTPLEATTVVAFPQPVRRPFYSVLDNAALRRAGLDRMRHWRVALEDHVRRRTNPSKESAPSVRAT